MPVSGGLTVSPWGRPEAVAVFLFRMAFSLRLRIMWSFVLIVRIALGESTLPTNICEDVTRCGPFSSLPFDLDWILRDGKCMSSS